MSTVLLSIGFLFSSVSFISTKTYTCDPSISCGCSAVSTVVTSRIVGGELAMNNTWGWMVSLRKSGFPICGASLITSEYAITAGHCVNAGLTDPSQLSILAGTNYLYDTSSTTAQQRTVIKVTRHPEYTSNPPTNDIAILQFSPLTISSTSNIAFICLPNANQDPFQTGSNLVATGWGYTVQSFGMGSDYLRQVTVPVVSSTSPNCSRLIKNNSNVEFCAGLDAGGKDTCQGDSGGPIMAFFNSRWVLAGLTSFGIGCAKPGYPGVYTRVSSFVSFITSNTNSSVNTSSPVTSNSSVTTNSPVTTNSSVTTNSPVTTNSSVTTNSPVTTNSSVTTNSPVTTNSSITTNSPVTTNSPIAETTTKLNINQSTLKAHGTTLTFNVLFLIFNVFSYFFLSNK